MYFDSCQELSKDVLIYRVFNNFANGCRILHLFHRFLVFGYFIFIEVEISKLNNEMYKTNVCKPDHNVNRYI